jgi:hypothetical protein
MSRLRAEIVTLDGKSRYWWDFSYALAGTIFRTNQYPNYFYPHHQHGCMEWRPIKCILTDTISYGHPVYLETLE